MYEVTYMHVIPRSFDGISQIMLIVLSVSDICDNEIANFDFSMKVVSSVYRLWGTLRSFGVLELETDVWTSSFNLLGLVTSASRYISMTLCICI
jgi:hypothetical protein